MSAKACILVGVVVVLATTSASPLIAEPRPARSDLRQQPNPSVAAVVARAGVTDVTMELRDLVFVVSADREDGYAAQRAAIRACHAGRYAQARDTVLTGRATPLRSC